MIGKVSLLLWLACMGHLNTAHGFAQLSEEQCIALILQGEPEPHDMLSAMGA